MARRAGLALPPLRLPDSDIPEAPNNGGGEAVPYTLAVSVEDAQDKPYEADEKGKQADASSENLTSDIRKWQLLGAFSALGDLDNFAQALFACRIGWHSVG